MEIDQMMGNIKTYITQKDKKKILKNFPKVEFCGACPFLLIHPEDHHSHSWVVDQKNKCQLMRSPCLWKIDRDGVYIKPTKEYHANWLDDSKNPKRNEQCLDFAIYLIKQCGVNPPIS